MCDNRDEELMLLRAEVTRLKEVLEEWGIGGGPPIVLTTRDFDSPIMIMEGDTVRITHKNIDGERAILSHKVSKGEDHRISRATIYQMRDALGFSISTMCVFGEGK